MDKVICLGKLGKIPGSKLWSIVGDNLSWYPIAGKYDFELLDDFM